MKPAIKIENLSKQYRLGLVGTGTISHDLKRWWHLVRGKEDPYLKIGDSNDRSTKGLSEYVWALKDINLEVMPGEVLGIIGKNGAGKSTLLKILSKVTGPTTGKITYNGRIGSLLEVGTGFHPELTGRENIYLNGAILGMRKREIDKKLDEIIDFSGCERYIDTPVKRYSSGMTVRLGFAVAAFLEPEILVVDEVLAVGDAEFQKKAIGKMQDVSKNDGRTVLFVSHNMGSIQQLCQSSLLLTKGEIIAKDYTTIVIDKYLFSNTEKVAIIENKKITKQENQFINFYNCDKSGNKKSKFKHNESIKLRIELYLPDYNENLELAISLQDKYKKRIFTIHEKLSKYNKKLKLLFNVEFPNCFILPGIYSWIAGINYPGNKMYDLHWDIANFSIIETGSQFARYKDADYGYINPIFTINEIYEKNNKLHI